ncbi:unnamed protein product [Rangifer tarandus platyrhynchus]|uniref:Uncharacterized protein n=2 Tax=Rangifer tarandus platyrhynchus TaxID=3082113 RepID=A0ABN8YEB6_RANTA|nr:unnamed protein product [Rangifer tarandus platyrhynchus]CAI9700224.1 unnamed protein product [Rangifer tarandus platyrhynchus]
MARPWKFTSALLRPFSQHAGWAGLRAESAEVTRSQRMERDRKDAFIFCVAGASLLSSLPGSLPLPPYESCTPTYRPFLGSLLSASGFMTQLPPEPLSAPSLLCDFSELGDLSESRFSQPALAQQTSSPGPWLAHAERCWPRTEDRGGRKARSAAPPAADSRGGRGASPGRKPGRRASRERGPPRRSLQVRRWPRKLHAEKFGRNSRQADARAGCRRGSPQPTPLGGGPRPLCGGDAASLTDQASGAGLPRRSAGATSPGPASPARVGGRVPRTTVKSRTGAAYAAVLHAGRSPALPGPRRQKPGLRTAAPREGTHAGPGCAGSHRQTRAQHQRRGEEREGGRKEKSRLAGSGPCRASAASPVRGLQTAGRAKERGGAPRAPGSGSFLLPEDSSNLTHFHRPLLSPGTSPATSCVAAALGAVCLTLSDSLCH